MSSMSKKRWMGRAFSGAAAVAVVLSTVGATSAAVKREGEWPEHDKAVSLDVKGVPRNEALARLASAAGWSVIVNAPPGDPVDVHVKDQPAEKILELLLSDADYVARRDGALISIAKQATPAAVPTAMLEPSGMPIPPPPPVPAAPPVPPPPPGAADADQAADAAADQAAGADADTAADAKERGRDRMVTGASLRIEKGEVVHDVTVMGGSLEILGTVTGDVDVAGGSTKVRNGARVRGDLSTVGGSVSVEDGARVDGDVNVVGGSLQRGPGAIVGGSVSTELRGDDEEGWSLGRLASDAGDAVTRMALLFLLGAVLLALAPTRMEALKVEVAARPMRSLAMGIVGSIAAVALLCAVAITVIGIPLAIVGVLLAPLAAFSGTCSVLETAGAAVLGHRTRSPYVHLAAGCAGLLVLGSIPYVGGLLWAATILIGIGALVSTRAAGLVKPRAGAAATAASMGPFRSIFG